MQSIEVLELPDVLALIARHATWGRGKAAVLALAPAASRDTVLARQAEAAEAIKLDEGALSPPLRGMRDVEEAVRAASRGVVLEPSTLLEISQVLRVAIQTRQFFETRAEDVPLLAARAAVLSALPHLVAEVESTLTSEAEVKETASPRLEELRVRIRTLQNRVQTRLQSILRNPSFARMFQEPYVTTRHDRHVLPIKAEYRSAFQGLVLDASASGATVFMEPYAVVDLDNELRELRVAEKHEVERILRVLSEHVGGAAADVSANAEIIAHLDMLAAVARFAAQTRCQLVPIDDASHILLRKARHPLLGARAVPIDVEITPQRRVVVITGPNTGGKTVTLKTVGVLTLMAMCGLPLPVGEGSRIAFVRGVYADIGDEQSIQQNLSTFSSHLTQITRILPLAASPSLVLLDEVGAGTDPREGTGLGVAILEDLHRRGAMVVCTTHYNELKTFASNFEGAVNASLEFDAETLQPTYRILMGIPGRSCALEISERLGLPTPILSRARELLGATHFSVEDLLANLEIERETAQQRQSQIDAAYAEADALRGRLRHEVDDLELQRTQARAEAAREAQDIIELARQEARDILSEVRGRLTALYRTPAAPPERADRITDGPQDRQENPADAQDVAGAPLTLSDAMRAVDDQEAQLRESLRTAARDFRDMEQQARRQLSAAVPAESVGPLAAGDVVYVPRLGQEAVVTEVGRGDVSVMIGKMRMTLPQRDVRKLRDAEPASVESTSGWSVVTAAGRSGAERKAAVSLRLDLRGHRAENAAYEVERYLDEVAVANVETVTIVHGKGTGVLVNVVAEALRAHPAVERFRAGDPGEGGWGVTVVTMK